MIAHAASYNAITVKINVCDVPQCRASDGRTPWSRRVADRGAAEGIYASQSEAVILVIHSGYYYVSHVRSTNIGRLLVRRYVRT